MKLSEISKLKWDSYTLYERGLDDGIHSIRVVNCRILSFQECSCDQSVENRMKIF